MINRELLKDKVAESGLKLAFIAEKCGMSDRTLWSKLQTESMWTVAEVDSFCKTLHLTASDRNKIFFA